MIVSSSWGPLNWREYASGLVRTDAKLPAAGTDVGLIHASRLSAEPSASDEELGMVTVSSTPSKRTAVLAPSAVSRLGWPSVGPFAYVPVLAPRSSRAVVPHDSPSRHQLTGAS